MSVVAPKERYGEAPSSLKKLFVDIAEKTLSRSQDDRLLIAVKTASKLHKRGFSFRRASGI